MFWKVDDWTITASVDNCIVFGGDIQMRTEKAEQRINKLLGELPGVDIIKYGCADLSVICAKRRLMLRLDKNGQQLMLAGK